MKIFIISAVMLIAAGFLFRNDIASLFSSGSKNVKQKKEKKHVAAAGDIVIKKQWDLPSVLREISGLAYMDADRFACVQDEAGTIYIYNTATASIEKEIPFAGAGDFEGITLKGDTAYIVRSDGVIFEVNMNTKSTAQYTSNLTIANNVESLFYDAANNRLLLTGKEPDPADAGRKNIFAFDLLTKKPVANPVSIIDLEDAALANPGKSSKKKKYLMPSALALHPVTGDMYILDGPKSRLLIAGKAGTVKNVYELGSAFFKPEGISFSPAGDLFISNEGKKAPANIMAVEIR